MNANAFIIFLLATTTCFAQKKMKEEKTIIKVNVISLVDFYFPTIQLGIERKLYNRFSISAEAGPHLYRLGRYDRDTSFVKNSVFKGCLEFRYYTIFPKIFATAPTRKKFSRRKPYERQEQIKNLFGTYIGLNLFNRSNTYNISVLYESPGNPALLTDYFRVQKRVWGSNLVLGVQKELGNKLTMDFYGGIGAIHRNTRNYERQYNRITDTLVQTVDVNIRSMYEISSLAEESGWHPNFNLGFRIGIRF
jgi:hypothetical protein